MRKGTAVYLCSNHANPGSICSFMQSAMTGDYVLVEFASGFKRAYSTLDFERYFTNIKEEGKEKPMKPTKETWKFGVSGDSLINLTEIEKNLTRKHPVAIVSYDEFDRENMVKYKMATVLIHESIYDKAHELDMEDILEEAVKPIVESQLEGDKGFVDIRSNFTRPIMAAVRSIRNAKVPGKKLEVTVDMLEI